MSLAWRLLYKCISELHHQYRNTNTREGTPVGGKEMEMLGSGFQRLEAAMVARERMQSALSSNIANAETPNYRADSRNFADFLAEQQSTAQTGKASTTNRMHFSDFSSDRHLSQNIFGKKIAQKMDGNNVNIQQEMVRMSENQLMHELSMRLIKGKLGGLMNAIKEGR